MGSLWLRRHRLLTLGLFLSLSLRLHSDDLPSVIVRDLSPGLETTKTPTDISDGAAQDLLNVDLANGSIQKRAGSVVLSSSSLGGFNAPVRFVWEYITNSGNRFIVSASSSTLFKSSDGGVNNSVLTSTMGFTTNSQYCAVNAFGKMRLTDGTTSWMTFDGTNFAASTATPTGSECAFFANRIWTAHTAIDSSTLDTSGLNDPEMWTHVSTDTSSSQTFQIRPNSGQVIRCLKPYHDRLLIFEDNSLDALVLNDDGLTFQLIPVSNTIGTLQCKSVVERENDVIFLSRDGVYKYDPSGTASAYGIYRSFAGGLTRISDGIRPTVSGIKQINTNVFQHTETTQADFNAGTLTNVNTTATVNSVTLSTQASTVDLGFEYVDPAGCQPRGNIYWTNNFNSSALPCSPAADSNPHDGAGDLFFPSVAPHSYTNLNFTIVNSTGGLINDFGNDIASVSTSAWTQISHDWSAFKGQSMKIVIKSTDSDGSFHSITQTSTFTFTGGIVTYWARFKPAPFTVMTIDTIEGIPTVGLYKGAAFSNNGGSTYGAFTESHTSGAGTVGPFTLYTDTDTTSDITNPSTFVSSQVVTNNMVPTMTPDKFSFFVSSFSISAVGTMPALNDISIKLNGAALFPTWGVYHKNSYILSVSTSNNTRNDTQFVYDRNGAWSLYGFPAYSFARLTDNTLLMGSASDGNIWQIQASQYSNDNGTAINSFWKSKDFDFGAPLPDKTVTRYYVTADSSTNGDSVVFNYGANRGTMTPTTLSLQNGLGLFKQVITTSSTNFNRGNTHTFQFSDATIGKDFHINSVTIKARIETQP